MKVYLDFEANADSEIISIGAYIDNDRKFYSLVKPHRRLDHMITKLTGITQEMVDEAENINMVIQRFFKWLPTSPYYENVEFCVFGDNDFNFMKKTAEFMDIPELMEWIWARTVDIQPRIVGKFHRKQLALVRIYMAMTHTSTISGNHNSEFDAFMLAFVDQNLDAFEVDEDFQFPKAPRVNLKYGKSQEDLGPDFCRPIYASRTVNGELREHHFKHSRNATGIIPQYVHKHMKDKKALQQRIIDCCNNGTPYCGWSFRWDD